MRKYSFATPPFNKRKGIRTNNCKNNAVGGLANAKHIFYKYLFRVKFKIEQKMLWQTYYTFVIKQNDFFLKMTPQQLYMYLI